MAVTIRNAGAEPPMVGDVLIRWLASPADLPVPGWTLAGEPGNGWFAWRVFINGDTYLQTDTVITPVDWRNASYGTAVEALRPPAGVAVQED